MEDLFLESTLAFEKTAAEAALPEDPNTWPTEILQELHKQVPYIADFDPHVIMERTDAERGYAFGQIEISNRSEAPMGASPAAMEAAGIQQVRIPIIVKNRKLQPMDVIVTADSKMLPLTEARLRAALFRPQTFDITGKTPGDQSMVGQLYPPFRQGHGVMGGGGVSMPMGKESSAKSESLLEVALQTANDSDYQKTAEEIDQYSTAFIANHGAHAALRKLAAGPRHSVEKVAHVLPSVIRATIAQIRHLTEGGYVLKTASRHFWAPVEQELDRGELVRRFGSKTVLAADLNGSVTIGEGEGAGEDPLVGQPQPISDYGIYKVHTTEGEELIGFVFPNLLDLDGTAMPLALFTNGSQAAVQGDIVGELVSEGATMFQGGMHGKGAFYRILPDGKAEAMIPMEIAGSFSNEGGESMMATDMNGRQFSVSVQPGIERPCLEGDTLLVPSDFQWMSLEQADDVVLAGVPEEVTKSAALKGIESMVFIRAAGSETFSIEGDPVEKLATDQKNFLSYDDAFFLLAGLGVDLERGQKKLAEAIYWSRPVEVKTAYAIETGESALAEAERRAAATLEKLPVLRTSLVKEAAAIPDPVAVDTILSLGFLNPENMSTFVGYLPLIDEAQKRMCELLVASRLGLREVEPGALEKAIKATEQVIEGLKVMAFQQN